MKKLTIISLFMGTLCLFAKDDRPNIILFLADDMARNTVGLYGNKQVKTPTIDKLGTDGVVFKNNYATTSVCMASRACIATGMYEYKTGCNFDKYPVRTNMWAKSYPVLLKEAGYFTGFGGKFGFAVRDSGNSSCNKFEDLPVDSYDVFYGGTGQTTYKTDKNKNIAKFAKEYPHSTRAYGAAMIEFIREAKETGKPFCFSMSFKAPHSPNTPDDFFDDIYKDTIWEKPSNFGRENGNHLAPQSKLGRQYERFFEEKGYADDYQNRERLYNQLIYGIDYAINMVLEELEKQGIADNTIIIITSDNGYSGGAHGFGGKVLPYEEASKTPLIIYDPRAKKASTNWRNAVAANIDLAPTILDYAGVAIPENMDGKSLKKVISDPNEKVREVLALIDIWGGKTNSYTVVSEDYKYIYWPYADNMPATEELFHISNDEFEMENVIENPEYKATLENMKALYSVELKRLGDTCLRDNKILRYALIFDQNKTWAEKKAAQKNSPIQADKTESSSSVEKSTKVKKDKKDKKAKKE